jgi:hypothetical protein
MSAGQYGVTSTFGGGSGVGPFLVPSGLSSGAAVTVYVVGPVSPGAPTGAVTLPAVTLPAPAPTTQSTFTLSIVAAAGQSPLPAVQIGVDKTLAWSADSTQRATMATAFKVFRAQLEALEAVSSPPLLPGASDLIVNRLASALPLRFDEVLTYYYAFDPAAQTIDLLPGMSLRVDWAGYQYCDGPGGPGYGLNGFGTMGTSHLEILRRPDGTLAFDGFSAQFSQGVSLQPPAACPVLAGGPVDLQLLGNGRRHLRLVWPTNFSGAGSVDNSGTINQLSCILLGASSFADLEAATALAVAGQSACGSQSSGADPIVSIAFTGRVTLVPEIWIWMLGTPLRVPVGTTVRNVAQRYADPIAMQMQGGGGSPTNFQLAVQRWLQFNAPPMNPGTPMFSIGPIDLSKAASAAGPLGDGFDTPLIKGDSLSIYVPGAS